MKVRLKTALSSYLSKEGSEFSAVVAAPFIDHGSVLVPTGSIVFGTVGKVRPVGWGLIHERARMELHFREYVTPDGRRVPIDARLASIDNAREQVTPQGQITGILAARNPNGLVAGFWRTPSPTLLYRSLIGLTGTAGQLNRALEMGPIGAAALFAMRCTILRFPEPEIQLPTGTEMKLALTVPPNGREDAPSPEPTEIPSDLAEWLRTKPREVTKANGKTAADIINIAFVGSRERLMNAFYAAGWSTAEPATLRTFSHAYLAFSSMEEYSRAPVSKLLYQGFEPGLVFQKSFNTISKRDHVRIWYGGSLDGQDAWLGAATHDSGVVFQPRGMKFTHKIDRAIDVERTKIVDDLSYAGCADAASFVNSSAPVPHAGAAKAIDTDGQIAVVQIGNCPGRSQPDELEEMPAPGTRAKRLLRRVVLEARNYLVRENAYYWTYELIKWHGTRASRAEAAE